MAALLITPKLPDTGQLDLRKYYLRQRVFFFPILAAILVQFSLLQLFLLDLSLLHPRTLFRHFGVVVLLGLAYSKSHRVHKFAILVVLGLFIFYSVFLFPSADHQAASRPTPITSSIE